jgi:hypothetical protein
MALPRPASPRALWSDLKSFLRQRSRYQTMGAIFAVGMPVTILTLFYYDSQTNIMPGEQIVYVKNWPATRTDAEIIAQQKIDQERREKALAERQRQYKQLEKRLGME